MKNFKKQSIVLLTIEFLILHTSWYQDVSATVHMLLTVNDICWTCYFAKSIWKYYSSPAELFYITFCQYDYFSVQLRL